MLISLFWLKLFCDFKNQVILLKNVFNLTCSRLLFGASLVVQLVKNVPAVQETQFPSLGQEDPLEKEMAIHSSILAWRIPWKEKPGRLQSMGSQRARHDWVTFTSEEPGVLQVVRLQRDRNNLVIEHQQQPHCIGYWAKSFSWLHHLILFTFPRGEFLFLISVSDVKVKTRES